MNCLLFVKMDKVFSLKQNIKKYWKMGKITGKAREFCQSGIVGTMQHVHSHFNSYTCVLDC